MNKLMQRLIFLLVSTLAVSSALAGHTYYAPDLADSDARPAWLGVVNHTTAVQAVVVEGYAADGSLVGSLSLELAPHERYEAAGADLFGSTDLAWASVSGDVPLVGYVRYAHDGDMSSVPLVRFVGPDVYLPGVGADGTGSQLALVNTAEESGEARSGPQRVYPHSFNARVNLHEPALVTGFGTAKAQLRTAYDSLLTGEKQGLLWDRLRGPLPMAGVQHFVREGAHGYGSLVPALTPLREMITAPLMADNRAYTTRFVLANTTDDILRVSMTVRDAFIPEPVEEHLELAPGEKRTLTFGNPADLTYLKPLWFHIRANENGLVGYQETVVPSTGAKALTEAAAQIGSRVVLPFVREDAAFDTDLTVINPSDVNASYAVSGFAADGRLVQVFQAPVFAPGASRVYGLEDLFGDKAASVSWVEVRALSGRAAVLSVVHARDGSAVSALAGTPTSFTGRSLNVADFEFARATELGPQEWTARSFNDGFSRPYWLDSGRLNDGLDDPINGTFFSEADFIAASGKYFFGYEPRIVAKADVLIPRAEDVALVSPFFEVPDYSRAYLEYQLRLINPEWATRGSRYGLVWRVEGSDDWQWFGVTGDLLLEPPALLADCWERVCYRGITHEVTLTPWFKFQTVLPAEAYGKRIQVGLYFNHIHHSTSGTVGPTVFVDAVRLTTAADAYAFYYEQAAGGVLPAEEAGMSATIKY